MSDKQVIYCVEDDINIQEIEILTLSSMGFEAIGCTSCAELFSKLENKIPDLILLDVMLPDCDGISILKNLKNKNSYKNIPVIMATARGQEHEKIQALNIGADDYLSKPFSMMEMAARIKAVLRRCKIAPSKTITIENLSVDFESHTVKVNNQNITLTNKEFLLLQVLLNNINIVFSRDKLLDLVWGQDAITETRTVDVHIRTLRQKLGEMEKIIKTVRGFGYKIEQ